MAVDVSLESFEPEPINEHSKKGYVENMSKIVYISWINPSQSVDLYPQVIDGLKINKRIKRSSGEFFFVETDAEAKELKSRMEQHIPEKSYSVLGEENKPIGSVVREPEVSILDIP